MAIPRRVVKLLLLVCAVQSGPAIEPEAVCQGHVVSQETDLTQALCQAQREALCWSLQQVCRNTSQTTDNSGTGDRLVWRGNCSIGGEDSVCSCLTTETDPGQVPNLPNVSLTWNPVDRQLQLSWEADPLAGPQMVHLLAHTNSSLLQVDSPHWLIEQVKENCYTVKVTDMCDVIHFRVATVSAHGSRGYTRILTHSVPPPGPPEDVHFSLLDYSLAIDADFVHFRLDWSPPFGWLRRDIQPAPDTPFWTECPPSMNLDMVYVFVDEIYSREDNPKIYSFTGRVPTYAIGCNITLSIQAVSRCETHSLGDPVNVTLELGCDVFPLYNGSNCQPPPVALPRPVEDIHYLLVTWAGGQLALLSWRPPSCLGSFPRVDYYQVFWGVRQLGESSLLVDLNPLLGNVTVPGTEFGVDLTLNTTLLQSYQTIGIEVMPIVQDQDLPQASVFLPDNLLASSAVTDQSSQFVSDDGVVVVIETDQPGVPLPRVDLYWRLHRLDTGHTQSVQAFYLQWGVVLEPRPSRESKFSDPSDFLPQFLPLNISRVDQEYFSIFDLEENTTYGLKIVPLYDVMDESSLDWDQAELHTFTTTNTNSSRVTTGTPSWSYSSSTTLHQADAPLLPPATWILPVFAALLVPALILVLLIKRRRRRPQGWAARGPFSLQPHDYTVLAGVHRQSVVDEWELPLTSIKLGPLLGIGAFGQVVKGRLTKTILANRVVGSSLTPEHLSLPDADTMHVTVAVKMLQEGCDSWQRQDFLKEIQLMKRLGQHQNVVSMLGCCTLREPISLVVEHAELGDLLSYLKNIRAQLCSTSRRDSSTLTVSSQFYPLKDLISFAWQVSSGMTFLSSKGFLHRDLAARNVLVFSRSLCKVGDFGLARYVYDNAVYVNRRGGRLPVKWMSLEAIFDMSFSTASDVWSFGILLYEMVTLGASPYPTIAARDLLKELQAGHRMERPENCPWELYELMRRCWASIPSERPTFSVLTRSLEEMMQTGQYGECPLAPLQVSEAQKDGDRVDADEFKLSAPALTETASHTRHGVITHNSDGTITQTIDNFPGTMMSSTRHQSESQDSGYFSPFKESVSSQRSSQSSSDDSSLYKAIILHGDISSCQPLNSTSNLPRPSSTSSSDDVFPAGAGQLSTMDNRDEVAVDLTKVDKTAARSFDTILAEFSHINRNQVSKHEYIHVCALRSKSDQNVPLGEKFPISRRHSWHGHMNSTTKLSYDPINIDGGVAQFTEEIFKGQPQWQKVSGALCSTHRSLNSRTKSVPQYVNIAIPTNAVENTLYHRIASIHLLSMSTVVNARTGCEINESRRGTHARSHQLIGKKRIELNSNGLNVAALTTNDKCREVRFASSTLKAPRENSYVVLEDTHREPMLDRRSFTQKTKLHHDLTGMSESQSCVDDAAIESRLMPHSSASRKSKTYSVSIPWKLSQYKCTSEIHTSHITIAQMSGAGNQVISGRKRELRCLKRSISEDNLLTPSPEIPKPQTPPASDQTGTVRVSDLRPPTPDLRPLTGTMSLEARASCLLPLVLRNRRMGSELLDSWSRVLRKTFSSPKENTGTNDNLTTGNDFNLSRGSVQPWRRLSDPFVHHVPGTCDRLPHASNGPSIPDILNTSDTRWPQRWKSSETLGAQAPGLLNRTCKKGYRQEKHPNSLHHI